MHYDNKVFFNRDDISALDQLEIMLELQRSIKDFISENYGRLEAYHCDKAEATLQNIFNKTLQQKVSEAQFPM